MKWSHAINLVLALALVLVITTASQRRIEIEEVKSNEEQMGLPQVITPVDIEASFDFAGEEMPRNWDALERIDRELTVNSYWHSNTLITLKRGHRYFPLIEKILREEGVPEDFKYVAAIESSLRNVTSPAGAKGFWQLMPVVAKSNGLVINSQREERYNIEKATRVACKHIKKYKERFGNWTNAAAAYNMGETRFSKAQLKQKEASYYDMNFSEETNRYMFRILAMKSIFENPSKFGFKLDLDKDGYPALDVDQIKVDQSIEDLAEWGHKYNCSYRLLKALNPWLISQSLSLREGETVTLYVPKA